MVPGRGDSSSPHAVSGLRLLGGRNSLGGALLGASAAVDAGVGVDFIVLCALGDRLGGAYIYTAAARDAGVGDYVGHGEKKLFWFKCGKLRFRSW